MCFGVTEQQAINIEQIQYKQQQVNQIKTTDGIACLCREFSVLSSLLDLDFINCFLSSVQHYKRDFPFVLEEICFKKAWEMV